MIRMFSKDRTQIVLKKAILNFINTQSNSNKGMKIKTKLKFHLNPVRINKYQQNDWQIVSRIWGMRDPYLLLVGLQTDTGALELVQRILKTAKNKSTMWLNCATPHHIPKGLNILLLRHLISYVYGCPPHNG